MSLKVNKASKCYYHQHFHVFAQVATVFITVIRVFMGGNWSRPSSYTDKGGREHAHK